MRSTSGHAYSPVTESSTKCFNDFVKYTQQQGLQLEVPSVGTVWPLGSATVTIVDEVHLEGGVLPVGRRRSGLRSCRVRHDVAAASRDDGRGITAHEAQRKGCGQRQRSEAAHERLSGHFFFFEVFHDVFSFC